MMPFYGTFRLMSVHLWGSLVLVCMHFVVALAIGCGGSLEGKPAKVSGSIMAFTDYGGPVDRDGGAGRITDDGSGIDAHFLDADQSAGDDEVYAIHPWGRLYDGERPMITRLIPEGQTSDCGDGIHHDGEDCDWGADFIDSCDYGDEACGEDGWVCTSACLARQLGAYCGDGRIDGSETCDDGNVLAGDGFDVQCQGEDAYDENHVNNHLRKKN